MRKIAIILSFSINILCGLLFFWFWTCIPKSYRPNNLNAPYVVAQDTTPETQSSDSMQYCTSKDPTQFQCSSWCQWPGKMLHSVMNWAQKTQSAMQRIAAQWHTECQAPPVKSSDQSTASLTAQLSSVV